MNNPDEPLFDADPGSEPHPAADSVARECIRALVRGQSYAVLCVQGGGQPYGALVAYTFSDDLRHVVFATPVTTRKYRLLSECDHVALVIDNRPDRGDDLMQVEAVTATGRSQQVARGEGFTRWADLLVSRHPYLTAFVRAETCALFRVDIVRFLHVMRFQEVRQWVPTPRC